MNTEEAEKQLKPYLIGDLTPKEEAILEGHLDVNEAAQWYHQRYYRQTLPILQQPEVAPSEGVLEDLFAKARRDIADPEVVEPTFGRALKIEFSRYWKVAAVLLIAVGVMIGMLWKEPTNSNPALGTAVVTSDNGNTVTRQVVAGETFATGPGHTAVVRIANNVEILVAENTELRVTTSEETKKLPTHDGKHEEFPFTEYTIHMASGDVYLKARDQKHLKAFSFTGADSDAEIGRVETSDGAVLAVHASASGSVIDYARSDEVDAGSISKTLVAFGKIEDSEGLFASAFLKDHVDTHIDQRTAKEPVDTKPKKLVVSSVAPDGSVILKSPDGKEVRVRKGASLKEKFQLDGKFTYAIQATNKDGKAVSRIYIADEKGALRYIDKELN